jgi:hypothetical protein
VLVCRSSKSTAFGALRHGDQEGVTAVFLGGFLNRFDQIDDLGPVTAFLFFDQLNGVGVNLHKVGDVLQLVN